MKFRGEKQLIIKNFFALSILNGINYIFPLILVPYLTRVLGVEHYGIYAFAFAVFQYLLLIVRYGFDFSATKEVAIIRDDSIKLSRYFYTVITLRIFFTLIASIILILLILFIPKFQQEGRLFLNGIGILFGTALLPIWFFQGMERMKFITIVNFISKLISLILIISLVRNKNDYTNVLLFQSIGYLIAAIISFYFAIKVFHVKLNIPSLRDLKVALVAGKNIFISTVGMNFYRESNVIILTFLSNYTIVGYYASAEKIVKAAQSITSPFVQAIFPYMGRKMNYDLANAIAEFKRVSKYYGILLISLVVFFLLFGNSVSYILLGNGFDKSYLNLKILSFILFFGGMNYYYGIIGLVNMGRENAFKTSVLIAGITSMIFCFIAVKFFQDLGAAMAMVLAEVVLFVLVFYHFNKRIL